MTEQTARPASLSPESMKAALARIYAVELAPDGARLSVGMGFFVDDYTVITCAHVVYSALGMAVGAEPSGDAAIALDLPLLQAGVGDGAVHTAGIEVLIPRQSTGAGDIAVLRLNAPIQGTRSVRLMAADGFWNHPAGVFGVPDGRPAGVWHSGLLKEEQANGWIQMNLDPASGGYPVSRGFSGSPVWDETLGVVGMLVVAEESAPAVSYLIPTRRLTAAWPKLRELTLPPSPFRPLKPFEESDQAIFHGREADSERVARAVGEKRTTTLIGPSGCGKSSLVQAGVIPRRRAEGDIPVVVRPARGSSPLHALAAGLVRLLEPGASEIDQIPKTNILADELAQHGLHNVAPRVLGRYKAARLLVVIDQFEELLDQPDDAVRAFAHALGGQDATADVAVLATLRADFVDPVQADQRLRALVSPELDSLLPMTAEQLREAITTPVEADPGVRFEDGLIKQILGDTGADPRVLPLLAFTLDQLWNAQERGALTFRAYYALGGVQGALSGYADKAWAGVADEEKLAARRLLTRLVRMPIGAQGPTRRVVGRTRLGDDEWRVVQRLAAARLIILNTRADADPDDALAGVESIELAHEVLITAWPVLAQLISADHAFLAWHESLRHDADRWDKAKRPSDLLPSRITLTAAQQFLPARKAELDDTEREYLDEGRVHRRRSARRRLAVITAVCVLAIVATTFGVVSARLNADTARVAATTRANNLAAYAAALAPSDPGLADQLAIAGYRTSPTQAAVSQLYATLNAPIDSVVANAGAPILQIAAQARGPLAAVVDTKGNLRIWNTDSLAVPVLDATAHITASAIAIAPHSGLLAAACPAAKALCLWSLADPRRPVALGQLPRDNAIPPTVMSSMAFSPDGALLAAAGENGRTYLWSTAQPTRPRILVSVVNPAPGTHQDLAAVAFDPRGGLLATTVQDGETELWNVADPAAPIPVATITTGYQAVAFSPDGALLAAVGDTEVGLWRLHDPAHPASINIDNSCNVTNATSLDYSAVAFSPGGAQLAFVGSDADDGRGGLCSMSLDPDNLNSDYPTVTGTPTGFGTFSMAFTASGALLAGGNDGIVHLWHWPQLEAEGAAPYGDFTWAISPSAKVMAAPIGSGQETRPLGIWDLTTPGGPTLDDTLQLPTSLQSVGFLNETTLLTVTHDGATRLWDVRDPRHPIQAAALGTANFTTDSGVSSGYILATGVSTDAAGTLVAVAGNDNRLHLWHVNDSRHATEVGSMLVPNTTADYSATLSDGRTAFTLTPTGIEWWNITDPAHPALTGASPLAGATKGSDVANGNSNGEVFAATTTEAATQGKVSLDLFSLADGKLNSTVQLPGPVGSTLGMSGDSRLFAVAGAAGDTITLWDTSDPKHPHVLAAVSAGQKVDEIAFDPSDHLMADWSTSGTTAQEWDITNPAAPVLELTLTTPDGSDVNSAGFTPSGAAFAIASLNGNVFLFDTDPTKLADRLCSYTDSAITTAEWAQYAPGIPYQNPCPS